MWIALWLKGSLQNIFSPAPVITEQGFLCSGAPLCTQPGTAMVSAQGLGEGAPAGSWQAFCGVKQFCTVTHSPQGDISTAWKTLSIAVQKYSSIHVFVAVTAIRFCADWELDIWISQLLCACAKGTPNNLEYTHEPILSTFTFHLIHAHCYCNLVGFWSVRSIWLN